MEVHDESQIPSKKARHDDYFESRFLIPSRVSCQSCGFVVVFSRSPRPYFIFAFVAECWSYYWQRWPEHQPSEEWREFCILRCFVNGLNKIFLQEAVSINVLCLHHSIECKSSHRLRSCHAIPFVSNNSSRSHSFSVEATSPALAIMSHCSRNSSLFLVSFRIDPHFFLFSSMIFEKMNNVQVPRHER